MNILLWGAFYIIATLFLLYFFIREKQVIQWIRMKEDETLKKVSLDRSDRNFFQQLIFFFSYKINHLLFSYKKI